MRAVGAAGHHGGAQRVGVERIVAEDKAHLAGVDQRL